MRAGQFTNPLQPTDKRASARGVLLIALCGLVVSLSQSSLAVVNETNRIPGSSEESKERVGAPDRQHRVPEVVSVPTVVNLRAGDSLVGESLTDQSLTDQSFRWRYTKHGWQDATQWQTVARYQPPQHFERIHPFVWSAMILLSSLLLLLWSTHETPRAR